MLKSSGNKKKAEFFIVTAVMLTSIFFSINQVLIGYNSVDSAEPHKERNENIMINAESFLKECASGSCESAERDLYDCQDYLQTYISREGYYFSASHVMIDNVFRITTVFSSQTYHANNTFLVPCINPDLLVYEDQDPLSFSGGWGWDGWDACCKDTEVKYHGKYSYRVEGGSEAWTSPLPDSTDSEYFAFAYRKEDPSCRANLYWYTNGDRHQVMEASTPFAYPGFSIPYFNDTLWHFVSIDLDDQVAGTDGKGNVNPRGPVTNFEFGPGGSCIVWYDYVFFY